MQQPVLVGLIRTLNALLEILPSPMLRFADYVSISEQALRAARDVAVDLAETNETLAAAEHDLAAETTNLEAAVARINQVDLNVERLRLTLATLLNHSRLSNWMRMLDDAVVLAVTGLEPGAAIEIGVFDAEGLKKGDLSAEMKARWQEFSSSLGLLKFVWKSISRTPPLPGVPIEAIGSKDELAECLKVHGVNPVHAASVGTP